MITAIRRKITAIKTGGEMKKRISIFLVLILGICVYSLANAQEKKITAAVMDLEAKEGIAKGLTSTLSDYLRTQLVNSNEYTMVTRENMNDVLREQKFQTSGCTSKECIVEAGQLLGVRKMFAGSIGKAGATYVVNLRIIDVQSGQIEKATTEECSKCEEDALLVSIKNITSKITGIGNIEKSIAKGVEKVEEVKPKAVLKSDVTQVRKITITNIASEEKNNTPLRQMGMFEKSALSKANQLYEQGKYDEALLKYEELRNKYPDNAIAYFGMGSVWYAKGDYAMAIDRLQNAILLEPKFADAHYWLGNAQYKAGQKDNAARSWSECLKIDPKHNSARTKLQAMGK